MKGVKAPKHLFGFLLESSRLVLLYFWLQHFNLPWNPGTEFNLFFLFLIFPQIILPLAWILSMKSPFPESYLPLGISVRWSVLGVDALACAWLFFNLGIDPGASITRPEFLLALLIGAADLTIIILLKGKSPEDSTGEPE